MKSVADVNQLVAAYHDSRIKHKLVNEDDYIATPRDSGYRSHHLVYRYYSDRSPTYEDLKIEMQIRSTLQHAWATAVEVVGMFTDQALKSAMGDDRWLRFFALMGSAIAIRERTPTVPGTPSTRKALVIELRQLVHELDVQNRLQSYQTTLDLIRTNPSLSGGHFFLLSLDTKANSLQITSYRKEQLEMASAEYLKVERANRSIEGRDAVLVSADGSTP